MPKRKKSAKQQRNDSKNQKQSSKLSILRFCMEFVRGLDFAFRVYDYIIEKYGYVIKSIAETIG